MKHWTFLENMYLGAAINRFHLPAIQISEGWCEINQAVNPEQFHAAHALHGSVLFKLLDDSAFFAANSVVEDYFVLTGTFETKFLKPVNAGELRAVGQLEEHSGRKLFATSQVYNDDTLVAEGKGIFIVSNIELSSLHAG